MARTLTELGDPAAAIETIETLRAARPAPEGSPPLCRSEYVAAARRAARAVALVDWAAAFRTMVGRTGEDEFPLEPQPAPPRACGLHVRSTDVPDAQAAEARVRRAVRAARQCDRHNEAAETLAEDLEASPPTRAESAEKAWSSFRSSSVTPWATLGLAALVWAAVVLVLARILRRVLRNRLARRMSSVGDHRRLALVLGWELLLLSAAQLVGSVGWARPDSVVVAGALLAVGAGIYAAATSTLERVIGGAFAVVAVLVPVRLVSPPDPSPGWAASLGLGAAVAFAAAWASGARLTIRTVGDDGPTADRLRALISQLGAAPPRGLEVPRGTDADFLEDIGIDEESSVKLVAALGRVLRLGRPPTPWQLLVTAHDGDVLTCELLRNHEPVCVETFDRVEVLRFLRQTMSDEDRGKLAMAPFAASMAVTKIAASHGRTDGLAGARDGRSVALQYLGSQQPRGGKAARALFSEAVAQDDGNVLAQVSLWNALFRESDDADVLERYRDLLDGAIKRTDDENDVLSKEGALRLRMLYSRVAVGINLVALGEVDRELPARSERLHTLARTASPDVDDAFRETVRRNTRVLLLSVEDLPAHVPTDPPVEEPEALGPDVNYSLGCYYATNGDDANRAVRHLRMAGEAPELQAWRAKDPQLEEFRTRPEYRTAFGAEPPTDPLTVAPFEAHATGLRAAGLVTLGRIGRADVADLEALGPARPVAGWLRRLARVGLAAESDPPLSDYRLVLVSTFAAEGYDAVPTDAGARDVLVERVLAACKPLKRSPDIRAVRRWMDIQVGLSPGEPATSPPPEDPAALVRPRH